MVFTILPSSCKLVNYSLENEAEYVQIGAYGEYKVDQIREGVQESHKQSVASLWQKSSTFHIFANVTRQHGPCWITTFSNNHTARRRAISQTSDWRLREFSQNCADSGPIRPSWNSDHGPNYWNWPQFVTRSGLLPSNQQFSSCFYLFYSK